MIHFKSFIYYIKVGIISLLSSAGVGIFIGCFFIKTIPEYTVIQPNYDYTISPMDLTTDGKHVYIFNKNKEKYIIPIENYKAAQEQGFHLKSQEVVSPSYQDTTPVIQFGSCGAAISIIPFLIAIWFLFLHCVGQLSRTIKGEER